MKITYVSIGILINENKEILLEKNETNLNFKGLWQFPGGKIENDETPIIALQRELKEELNIEIDLDSTKKLAFTEYENNNNYYVILFYICKKWNQEITAKINQELQWVSFDTIQKLPCLPYNIEIIDKLSDII